MSNKILIVGGVAGGASVAARARRLDESAEIIMYERGPHISFSNCCLPNFLGGEIDNSEKLVLMTPQRFKAQFNINAVVNHEVIKILPDKKALLVKNLISGEEYEESYDKLFLSPGAAALRPKSIEGVDGENVFIVKNIVDVVKIESYLQEHNGEDIVVVGGGFIGVECAEGLKHKGKNVTLVEMSDQIMNPFDYDMAQVLHKEILDGGMGLVLNDSVVSIQKDKVRLASGKEIKAQAVIMAIGVVPDTALAEDAGIEIGKTGGIKVDSHFRTNIKDIYAVGDAIEVFNSQTRKKTLLPLAGPAQRQARAAADSAYGRTVSNKGVIGSSCVRIFNLNGARTGLNEKECIENGIDYDFVYLMSNDKVSLMPKVNYMHFKLIFERPTGRILGAQAIGKGNVDKRVDIIATMITMGGTLEDLKELELCYAPPFSTAKDVLIHGAHVGLNILNGEYKQVPVTMIRELVESGAFIVDVREKGEYDHSHLTTSVNIPMSEFRSRISEIPKDIPVYIHCRSGQRSYNVVRALGQLGYDNVYNISGSFLGLCVYEYYNDKAQNRKPIVTDYNFK